MGTPEVTNVGTAALGGPRSGAPQVCDSNCLHYNEFFGAKLSPGETLD